VRDLLDPSYKIAVESGSFKGDSTSLLPEFFERVYTIEIDPVLHDITRRRFVNDYRVVAILGDSGRMIKELIDSLSIESKVKALFWLDGHWSGDTSVRWENSAWKGYGFKTGFVGMEETINPNISKFTPSSKQQVPLDREIFEIFSRHTSECIVYIDDFDKINQNTLQGMANFKFDGEDWTHLDFRSLILLTSGRIEYIRRIGNRFDSQLVLKFSSFSGCPPMPNIEKTEKIIKMLTNKIGT
jgi:hypothetical protein